MGVGEQTVKSSLNLVKHLVASETCELLCAEHCHRPRSTLSQRSGMKKLLYCYLRSARVRAWLPDEPEVSASWQAGSLWHSALLVAP